MRHAPAGAALTAAFIFAARLVSVHKEEDDENGHRCEGKSPGYPIVHLILEHGVLRRGLGYAVYENIQN